jgi:hypothetical protein
MSDLIPTHLYSSAQPATWYKKIFPSLQAMVTIRRSQRQHGNPCARKRVCISTSACREIREATD